MTKRMLTEKETSEYVGMSHNSCRKFFHQAIVRFGRAVRYDIVILDKIIEERSKDERVNSLDV